MTAKKHVAPAARCAGRASATRCAWSCSTATAAGCRGVRGIARLGPRLPRGDDRQRTAPGLPAVDRHVPAGVRGRGATARAGPRRQGRRPARRDASRAAARRPRRVHPRLVGAATLARAGVSPRRVRRPAAPRHPACRSGRRVRVVQRLVRGTRRESRSRGRGRARTRCPDCPAGAASPPRTTRRPSPAPGGVRGDGERLERGGREGFRRRARSAAPTAASIRPASLARGALDLTVSEVGEDEHERRRDAERRRPRPCPARQHGRIPADTSPRATRRAPRARVR